MVIYVDRRIPLNETILQRGSGNVAGMGAGAKWLYNKVRGKGDQNAAGFRETTRNARYTGTIKAHAKAIRSLVGEINRFIAQQSAEGKDTSELEKITNGINDFFAKNEKVFGFGIGDADAEDYKNTEVETPSSGAEDNDGGVEAGRAAEPGSAESEDAADVDRQQDGSEIGSNPAGGSLGARPGADSGTGRRQASQQRPAQPPKKHGWWMDGQTGVPTGAPAKKRGWWMDESAVLDALYGAVCLDEGVSNVRTDVGMLYNTLLVEAQTPVGTQAGQADQRQMNDVAAKVFAQLGDMADRGTEEDKDFVYQLIQKLASGRYTMQNAMQDIASRAQQGQQGQQGQQVAAEAFDGARRWMEDRQRKFFARQAGKQAAKSGGDRKAAEQEAYGNRIYEFQTRLDRELGELSLDLKTMGYKQQAGDADRLLKAFRQAVAQYSKSGKEEGETSWLQRRRHGLGHWAATWATYRALHMLCPATILGSPYFRKAVMGAATSVIRDVSRDNLNKKSILRALAGAGIAVGATIAGEMLRPSVVTNMSREYRDVNGRFYGKETTETAPGNLGTRIRSWFDKDLRSKFGSSTNEFGDLSLRNGGVPDASQFTVGQVQTPGGAMTVVKGPDGRVFRFSNAVDRGPGFDPVKAAQQQYGGSEIPETGRMSPKLPGTYEAGIRTADANGNPISLSPEDTAKVNAVRNIRNQMAGGPMSGDEPSQELMNLPKYTAPKLKASMIEGDEIQREMIGKRAWAAARGITKNGNGSGVLSELSDHDGYAATQYIEKLAEVDRPLATWFEKHPDDFNALAKYVGDKDNVKIDNSQFSALVRKVGSVKEALRQIGRRMTPEEIADRAERIARAREQFGGF